MTNGFCVLATETFVVRVLFWPALAGSLLAFFWSVRDAVGRNRGWLLVKSAILLAFTLNFTCVKLLQMQGIGFERVLPAGTSSVTNVLMTVRDAIPLFVCICFAILVIGWWMDDGIEVSVRDAGHVVGRVLRGPC